MSHQHTLEQTYILHTRAYRDTSLLLECFTKEHGRITVVARGVRSQRSKQRGILQPFIPLLINWFGKNDLVTLKNAEVDGQIYFYSKNILASALYLNELLMKVLTKFDPHPKLFDAYAATLQALHECSEENNRLENILRLFEIELLNEIGYGLNFKIAADGHEIVSEKYYSLHREIGFISQENMESKNIYMGKHLLDLSERKLDNRDVLATAKRILRRVFAEILENKTINSRELFI